MYTNTELIDSLLIDLNDAVRALLSGQYIAAAGTVSQMAQKLMNLRAGVESDIKSRDQCIEDLRRQIHTEREGK